jgi:hypothetical protein
LVYGRWSTRLSPEYASGTRPFAWILSWNCSDDRIISRPLDRRPHRRLAIAMSVCAAGFVRTRDPPIDRVNRGHIRRLLSNRIVVRG